jgi:hypothetical protein
MTIRTAAAAAVLASLIMWLNALGEARSQGSLGTWTLKAPLPAVRAEVAAIALDGKFHALGGVVNNKSVSSTTNTIRTPTVGAPWRRCRKRAIIWPSPWLTAGFT